MAIEHDASVGDKIRQHLATYQSTREYWFGLRKRFGAGGGGFGWIDGETAAQIAD